MRCPSCGTENAQDSRFCGGCGAKLTPAAAAAPRLAPTAKIPDDAPFPASTGQRPQVQAYQQGPASIPPPANPYGATGPASIPPAYGSAAPASIPPSRAPHVSQPRAQSAVDSLSGRPTPMASELRAAAPRPGSEPAFGSIPPTQQRKPPRAVTPQPDGSMPGTDDSFVAPPQRPLGLIAIVLVIDFALAGAGAVLLAKGLAKKPSEDASTPKAPELKMQQRTEAAPMPPSSPTEAVAAAAPAPEPVVDVKADAKLPAAASALVETKSQARAKESTKKSSSGAKTPTADKASSGPVTHPGGTAPEDPYKDQPDPSFDLKAESNRLASQSGDLFTRCLNAAGAVHGTVKVAYRVDADGRVSHPFAVENSTGNEQLGICLSDVIATWRFSPHAGEAQNAVRPFTYP